MWGGEQLSVDVEYEHTKLSEKRQGCDIAAEKSLLCRRQKYLHAEYITPNVDPKRDKRGA